MRIAFIGPIGCGKTYASDLCVHYWGGKRISFAYEVKREVFEFLQSWRVEPIPIILAGFPDVNNMSLPPLNLTSTQGVGWINTHKQEVRKLLQVWGTDYKRSLDNNYWIKKLEATLKSSEHLYADDCRFINEADFLADKGFQFIGLRRPGEIHDSHSSELGVYEIIEKYKVPVLENLDSQDLLSLIKERVYFGNSNQTMHAC